ncbi:MAG TPA: T9SS type A sorting domain-containing protein [Ignavibacteriaceae bacterium]|nr:T9SS type A sorting domain-containing protein [Ignavibacteriaceae bacterium]
MIKLFLPFMLLLLSACALAQVQLQFITTNAYGNNLYIDNLQIGTKFNQDVAVVSINNIFPDTNYTIGSAPFTLAPKVTLLNLGVEGITASFDVVMVVSPGGYTSTKSVSSLAAGESREVIFDNLTITPGQPVNITVTSDFQGDQNPANNSLSQFSAYFPGVKRNLLLEEFTSSTCSPCASNNPAIDAFVSARFDSMTAIKYHMNWPSPGNDPMYHYNPAQNTERRNYYSVQGVPDVIMDGTVSPSYPYSSPASLPDAYYPRTATPSPISMNVVNTRIGPDSIRTLVSYQILSPLPLGNYFLRVMAVERHIKYSSAPGSNGERDFYDVFRRGFPSMQGTPIPASVGSYQFTITFPVDKAVWVDSMIYTAAFIQNDLTKEVMNSAKSRNYAEALTLVKSESTPVMKKALNSDILHQENNSVLINPESVNLSGVFFYNLFEGSVPPPGWTLKNPDGGITFRSVNGVNGPSVAGNKAIFLSFYDYSASGQKDTLVTKVFSGLLSSDTVRFDYAYAPYSGSYPDRLTVKLSTDGGLTFPYTVFDKAGATLATTTSTTNSFVPTSPSQWQTYAYALDMIVPVELNSFSGVADGNNVRLEWTTASEKNNLGFEIQKKFNSQFVTVGFVEGMGTSATENVYSFVDMDLQNGSYAYRLRQVDYNGSYEFSQQVEVEVAGLSGFALSQNYPNPFNPETVIAFTLPEKSAVKLEVFNSIGEKVAELFNGNKEAGNHRLVFNASNLPSGIYLYRLSAGANVQSKKLLLLK